MTVSELIEKLKAMPGDAEIFYGYSEGTAGDPPGFTMFDFVPNHYPVVRSYGNASPRPPREHKNVVVFEHD